MNKKQSNPAVLVGTPKAISRNTRAMSQNSSSNSIKAKLGQVKTKLIDKENLSSNFIVEDNKGKSEETLINKFKGLKRIKEKIQKDQFPQNQRQKQITNKIDKVKSKNTKTLQKNNSQNHSNRSLLANRSTKNNVLHHQSDKKNFGFQAQKQTPKNISKKFINSKFNTKKTEPQISFNTITNESQTNYHESRIEQTIINQLLQEKKQTKTVDHVRQNEMRKGLMISMFKIKGKLSEGAFSTTFQVIHIETGFLFCLKVFEKNKIKQQGLQDQLIEQIKFRKNMKNKNLQNLFAYFDDQVYIYFIEEYLIGFGGLQKQLLTKRRLSQKQSGVIFKETLQIVRYIHSFNYIHRDIRLNNLVRCLGVIKLTDFSWVASLRHKKQRDTFCGTYKYAPPELLEGENYDESIDIWSLGILLYELCTGQSPFSQGFGKRSSHSMNFPIFLSNELVDIIGRLLSEKGARMRIQQIMMHEWINKWDLDGLISKQFWDFWVL